MSKVRIRNRVGRLAAAGLAGWSLCGVVRAEMTAAQELEQFKAWVGENYAAIVHANYEDSHAAVKGLRGAVKSFLADPSEAGLTAAKEAWVAARVPYLQTEAFRFYDGPIDGEDGPEGLINAWPMDEAFVDYVEGAPEAGIVNAPDKYPKISIALLKEVNELGGETNIAAGFHAIEFLLWGQDMNADGPGQRPASDYTTAPNAGRRAAYLGACVDLLEANLEEMVAAWAPEVEGSYRSEFLSGGEDEALEKMLHGVTMLAGFELSGERLLVAYDTQAQEDEHSCFSDTTHLDTKYDAVGIANVYFGRYRRTDGTVIKGPSLKDLAETIDGDLEARLDAGVKRAVELCAAVPAPFDQAVLGADDKPERVAIMDAIVALDALSVLFKELVGELGYSLPDTGDVDG